MDSIYPCNLNAECQDTDGSYICTCNDGYRGDGFISCVNIDECIEQLDDCHELASCTDNNGSYTCDCNMGFEGSGRVCTDVNECTDDTDNCDTNAICINTEGSYTCSCNDGYFSAEGGNARMGQCQDSDECAYNTDSCSNEAVCTNTDGSYTCTCIEGFEGNGFNCSDINECRQMVNPCDTDKNERCVNNEGAFYCTCQTNFFNISGQCTEANAKNMAIDFEYIQGLQASMFFDSLNADGVGAAISMNMDDLFRMSVYANQYYGTETTGFSSAPDGIRATFIVTFNVTLNITDSQLLQAFLDGLTGRDNDILPPDSKIFTNVTDVSEPIIDRCFDGTDDCRERFFEVCESTGNDMFVCSSCFNGFEINEAQDACSDVNECITNNPCPDNAMCNNTIGSYVCQCNDGYLFNENDNTCDDVNECINNPCPDSRPCNNTMGGYTCGCDVGFILDMDDVCQDINECMVDGLCPGVTTCQNTMGSYICLCETAGYMMSVEGGECADIDECTTMPEVCGVNTVCNNTEGNYTCTCAVGYSLVDDVCSDNDECTDPDICGTNEVCVNTDGAYSCDCVSGYVPVNNICSDIDECTTEPDVCGVNTVCNNTEGNYTCTCAVGYSLVDDVCSDNDECTDSDICGTNGVCVNTDGGYSCDCVTGYVPVNTQCSVALSYRGEILAVTLNGSEVEFTPDLEDPTSALYIEYSNTFTTIIDYFYQQLLGDTFFGSSILGYKNGSIIVVYQLDFFDITQHEADELLTMLLNSTVDSVLLTPDGFSIGVDMNYEAVVYNLPIDCTSSSCNENGNCSVSTLEEIVCSCFDGFNGDACENCDNSYCNNRGNCSVVEGTRECLCMENYSGDQCEKETEQLPVAVIVIVVIVFFLLLVLSLLTCFVFIIRKRRQEIFKHHVKGRFVSNPAAGLRLPERDDDRLSISSYAEGYRSDTDRMAHLANVIRNSTYFNTSNKPNRPKKYDSVSSDQFMRPYVVTGNEASSYEEYASDTSSDDYRQQRGRFSQNNRNGYF
ncbi:uncharacterized protein [Antedon mediterranea]|uniref:uncharacterized protein n=1 Tax=Antedon mediterranea TaxID=105859 RepID=UPI003AF70412